MYERVKNGELDCAFVSYQPSLLKGLNWFSLRVDELMAVLPAGYPVEGESFPVERFNGADFLMPSLGFEMDINPLFAAQEPRVSPRTRHTNMDDVSLILMVEHGLGLTILSRLILQGMTAEVRTLPLAPRGYRSLGLIVSASRQGESLLRSFVRSTRASISAMYAEP